MYLLHLVLAGLDVGHCSVCLSFADFRKGFDLVDHNIIVDELGNLNVHHCSVRLYFADFRKGFDFVDHNIIIDELGNLNVHPAII